MYVSMCVSMCVHVYVHLCGADLNGRQRGIQVPWLAGGVENPTPADAPACARGPSARGSESVAHKRDAVEGEGEVFHGGLVNRLGTGGREGWVGEGEARGEA